MDAGSYQLGYAIAPPPDNGSSANAVDYLGPAAAGHDLLSRYGVVSSQDAEADAEASIKRTADVIETSFRAARYTQSMGGNDLAMGDAIDARNQSIFQQTGEQLENPMAGGYSSAAFARLAQERPDLAQAGSQTNAMGIGTTGADPYESVNLLNTYRMDAYNLALAATQKKHAAVPGLDASIVAARNATIANAEQDQAKAIAAGGGGLATLPAQLIGGVGASFRDPIQVAALAIPVGGELRAASTFGRVVEGALRAGAVNAGIEAVQEPKLQQNRADRGVDHGLLPALADIGTAGLFGAGFGALHVGVTSLLRRHDVPVETGRAAVAGDLDAAHAIAKAVPRETAPVHHAATLGEALDRAVMDHRPGDADPASAATGVRDAIRYGEGIGPLPELVASRADPKPAEAAIAAATNLDAAVEVLHGAADLHAGALASEDPQTLAIGRLASLSDEASAQLRDGVVPPIAAAHIPAIFPDPLDHAPALDALAAEGVTTEAGARAVLSAEALVKSHPEAVATILGDGSSKMARHFADAARREAEFEDRIRGRPTRGDPGYSPTVEAPDGYVAEPLANGFVFRPDHLPKETDGRPTGIVYRMAGRTASIETSLLPDVARGQGKGLDLYRAFVSALGEKDITLKSDRTVTPGVARIYDTLAEEGFLVHRDPTAETIDGATFTKNGEPVYHIDPPSDWRDEGNAGLRTFGPDRLVDLMPLRRAAGAQSGQDRGQGLAVAPGDDLLDRVPLADREDGGDVGFAHPGDLGIEPTPEEHLAQIIKDCPF